MPIVKLSFGSFNERFSKTAFISFSGTSLEDNPYLPPYTLMFLVLTASITSKHNGSLTLPNSLVLSNTAITSVDAGNSFNKYSLENGLYK